MRGAARLTARSPAGDYEALCASWEIVVADQTTGVRPSTRALHAAGLRRGGATLKEIALVLRVGVTRAWSLARSGERWLALVEEGTP